jgi:hypothetical protein
MKNIHVLSTEKPSDLWLMHNKSQGLMRLKTASLLDGIPQHIYITSDEASKEGNWIIWSNKVVKAIDTTYWSAKKIILTTDQDLIKDGVQGINDEFLEWFVKNPSCEWVRIAERFINKDYDSAYVIIIPKQEPLSFPPFDKEKADVITKEGRKVIRELHNNIQQDTLEEAAERNCESITHPYCDREKSMFIKGAKWQAERMYTEEEVLKLLYELHLIHNSDSDMTFMKVDEWFEQFKKK